MALPIGFRIKAHQQCHYSECRGKQGIIVDIELDIPQPDGSTADVYVIDFPTIGEYKLTLGDFFAMPNDDLLKP